MGARALRTSAACFTQNLCACPVSTRRIALAHSTARRSRMRSEILGLDERGLVPSASVAAPTAASVSTSSSESSRRLSRYRTVTPLTRSPRSMHVHSASATTSTRLARTVTTFRGLRRVVDSAAVGDGIPVSGSICRRRSDSAGSAPPPAAPPAVMAAHNTPAESSPT